VRQSAWLAMQSAVLAMIDSVCLSVCPSQSGIMSKLLKLRVCSLHWRSGNPHDSSIWYNHGTTEYLVFFLFHGTYRGVKSVLSCNTTM